MSKVLIKVPKTQRKKNNKKYLTLVSAAIYECEYYEYWMYIKVSLLSTVCIQFYNYLLFMHFSLLIPLRSVLTLNMPLSRNLWDTKNIYFRPLSTWLDRFRFQSHLLVPTTQIKRRLRGFYFGILTITIGMYMLCTGKRWRSPIWKVYVESIQKPNQN